MANYNNRPTYDIGNVSGGVQSTTMFHLALAGILPRPDCFIFADTGWERKSSYETIERLQEIAEYENIPFHIVDNGNIKEQAIESGNPDSDYGDWRDPATGYGFLKMPVYTIDQMGNKPRMSAKQCTTDFKIRPIQQFLRERYGKRAVFNQWIGISLDETQRMRVSDVKYIRLTYPLVDLKWSRGHCIEWLKAKGIEIPQKSACVGCPFHGEEVWQNLTEQEKSDAVEFDEEIRHLQAHVDALPKPKKLTPGQLTLLDLDEIDEYVVDRPIERKQDVELYLHRTGFPLKDVLEGKVDTQQELYDSENEECTGMCFV